VGTRTSYILYAPRDLTIKTNLDSNFDRCLFFTHVRLTQRLELTEQVPELSKKRAPALNGFIAHSSPEQWRLKELGLHLIFVYLEIAYLLNIHAY